MTERRRLYPCTSSLTPTPPPEPLLTAHIQDLEPEVIFFPPPSVPSPDTKDSLLFLLRQLRVGKGS